MVEAIRGKIQLCIHCNDKAVGSSKFCANCKTAEGRREMDEANVKHFKDHRLEYHCVYCEGQVREREEKAERDKRFSGVESTN